MSRVKIFILAFSIALSFSAKSQTTNYQVYALFVVNIAKYSSWPNAGADMEITVIGKSKVYDALLKQNGKNVNGQVIKVKQVESVADIGQPNILYVADGKSGSIDEILQATQGKPVMIIGERESLFKKGAGFSFLILDNGTLRYDMNNGELEKRQIKVSKNLSALANSTI
ncbi:MAG TPA: YfiR family protein [Chryseolinea sp.]|nr:YfiR family protein [Chryseolinea sp.]